MHAELCKRLCQRFVWRSVRNFEGLCVKVYGKLCRIHVTSVCVKLYVALCGLLGTVWNGVNYEKLCGTG